MTSTLMVTVTSAFLVPEHLRAMPQVCGSMGTSPIRDIKKKRIEIEKQFLHLAFSQRAGKSVGVAWRKWPEQLSV